MSFNKSLYPGSGPPSWVGMVNMWGHKQAMGLVRSLRYRQKMCAQNVLAGGTRHHVKFNSCIATVVTSIVTEEKKDIIKTKAYDCITPR